MLFPLFPPVSLALESQFCCQESKQRQTRLRKRCLILTTYDTLKFPLSAFHMAHCSPYSSSASFPALPAKSPIAPAGALQHRSIPSHFYLMTMHILRPRLKTFTMYLWFACACINAYAQTSLTPDSSVPAPSNSDARIPAVSVSRNGGAAVTLSVTRKGHFTVTLPSLDSKAFVTLRFPTTLAGDRVLIRSLDTGTVQLLGDGASHNTIATDGSISFVYAMGGALSHSRVLIAVDGITSTISFYLATAN